MKWGWRVIALVLLAGVMLAAPWAARTAVVDVKEKLKPEKAAWEGVITVGIVPSFPTVNVDGWLNACFRGFEKQEGNVLVSLRELTEVGVRTGAAAGTLPDVLLVGLNVLDDPANYFVCMEGETTVREDLRGAGTVEQTRYAVPLAMGGYALLGNRRLLDTVGWSPELGFEETMALLTQKDMALAAPQMAYTDPAQAFSRMGEAGQVRVDSERIHSKIWPDFVIEEKYVFYVCTQREIKRMQTLQSAGKGFETVLVVPKGRAYTDQVLLGGMVRPELTAVHADDENNRAEWIGRLFRYLLAEEQQRELTRAGLFSVTQEEAIYEEGTQMAALEMSLRQVQLP